MRTFLSKACRPDTFTKALARLSMPVVAEFPFFAVYMLRTSKLSLDVLLSALLGNTALYGECVSAIIALGVCVLRGYLACLLIYKVGSKWLKILVYTMFFLGMTVNVFLNSAFLLNISPTVLTLLAETNSKEASDFLHTFVLSSFPLTVFVKVGICVLLVLALEWLKHHYTSAVTEVKRAFFGIALLPWLVLGLYGFKMYVGLFRVQTSDDLTPWEDECPYALTDEGTRILESLWGVHLASKEMEDAVQTTLKALNDNDSATPSTPQKTGTPLNDADGDSLNIVLVIGESFIKWHSSLYGYRLCTSPCMESERQAGNLWAFENAFAPYNSTSKVLRNLLYCNSLADGEKWSKTPYFPALMKKAGYQVYGGTTKSR